MTWRPIIKETCWCQEKHPMGSVCGCWSCPDCHRWYPCNPIDESNIQDNYVMIPSFKLLPENHLKNLNGFANQELKLFDGEYTFFVKENCPFAKIYPSNFNHYIKPNSIIEAI